MDPHTAVGYRVYRDYCRKSEDKTVTVITATASPCKFSGSVLEALRGRDFIQNKDEFTLLHQLAELDGISLHPGLRDLEQKPVLHQTVCEKTEVRKVVEKILGE